ncbi:MAG: hypothetical protein AAGF36_07785 [Pseudomonadota bacterium]
MRLFSLVSALMFVAGAAAADCTKTLRSLQGTELAARMCAAENTMPFDIRERWINKRFVAFAEKPRFDGDTKVQRAGILDPSGQPFASASAAQSAVQWLGKTARCKTADVALRPGGVTTLRLICPVSN